MALRAGRGRLGWPMAAHQLASAYEIWARQEISSPENHPSARRPVGAPGRGCDRPSCRTGPPWLADGRARLAIAYQQSPRKWI